MTSQGGLAFEQSYPPSVAGPVGPAGAPAPLSAPGIVAPQTTTSTAWTTVGTVCLSATAAGADLAPGTLAFSALLGMLPGATSGGDLRLVSVATGLPVLTLSTSSTTPVWRTATLADNLQSAFYLQIRITTPGESLVVHNACCAQTFP